MVTSGELDDPDSPRIALYRPRFLAAPAPDPDLCDWMAWESPLGSRDAAPDAGFGGCLFIDPTQEGDPHGFGTVRSSLIALPQVGRIDQSPIYRFASGPPEDWRWEDAV